jgi:hypothetical protein
MAVATAAAAEAARYAWTVAGALADTAVSTAPWVAACAPTPRSLGGGLFAGMVLARPPALTSWAEVGEHGCYREEDFPAPFPGL